MSCLEPEMLNNCETAVEMYNVLELVCVGITDCIGSEFSVHDVFLASGGTGFNICIKSKMISHPVLKSVSICSNQRHKVQSTLVILRSFLSCSICSSTILKYLLFFFHLTSQNSFFLFLSFFHYFSLKYSLLYLRSIYFFFKNCLGSEGNLFIAMFKPKGKMINKSPNAART